MAVALNSFLQMGEFGDNAFPYQATGDDNKKYLFIVTAGSSNAEWKSSAYLTNTGVSASVIAQFESALPSAGFVGQFSQNGSTYVPLPAGVQGINLHDATSAQNNPVPNISWVSNFVPVIGFTSVSSTGGNVPAFSGINQGIAPAVDYTYLPAAQPQPTLTRSTVFDDAANWVKANPVTSVVIGVGAFEAWRGLNLKKGQKYKLLGIIPL
jgi:hypothetical protein